MYERVALALQMRWRDGIKTVKVIRSMLKVSDDKSVQG